MPLYRYALPFIAFSLLAACGQGGHRSCSPEALRAGTCTEYVAPGGGDDRPINSYK